MDTPSNSASSFCSSAAAPLADGQDDRAVARPAQDSPASPATKEPHLSDPSSSSASPSPDEIMRPSSGSQAAFSSPPLPAAISSTPELQADFGLVTPNPSPFPQATPHSEDGKKEEEAEEDGEEEDGGKEVQLYFSAEGSAYLLSGGHVLLPKGSPSTTVPLVSILHVQCGGGPNQGFMSTDQMSQNTSALSEWTPRGAFRSYRLAGAPVARTTSAKNVPTKPKDALTGLVEDEEHPKGEANLGQEPPLQPPVWLCLTCHLSFRRGHSLAAHACAAHGVQLSANQCQTLSRGASAVFQGTTVGFLEPNSPTTKADLNARMCSRWVNVTEKTEEEKESQEGECEPPDAKDSRVGGAHWAKGGTEDKPKTEEKEGEKEEAEAEKEKEEGVFLSDQSSHGQSPPVGVNPSPSETPQKKVSSIDSKVRIGLAKEEVGTELAGKEANEVIGAGLAQ